MAVGMEEAGDRGKSLINRIMTAGGERRTRFHDEANNAVSFSRAFRNGPRALSTTLLRLLFDHRPSKPWISYDAQRVLADFLKPGHRVLEFGSGMSTLWYARKAGQVVSIEDFDPWFRKVRDQLRAVGNVDYRFASGREAYANAAPEGEFDLIMIDGSWRDRCAEVAIGQLRQGGIIYLDNSDRNNVPIDSSQEWFNDVQRARAILLEHAESAGLPVREFTDFAPAQFHVQSGLMIGGPGA